MKGYKVFKPDWTTMNNFQWEVGKTYEHTGDLEICASGFHFCKNLVDCFQYYDFDPENKVAEVEVLGKIEVGFSARNVVHKCVTDKIKIVREIPWEEVLTLVNVGHENTGIANAGNYNSGRHNVGNGNTGHYNVGDNNTGDWNVGDYNSGRCNTGNSNSGGRNTGYNNTGNYNTGNYNNGSYNTGWRNAGSYNTGDSNIGDWNSGSYNIGDFNSGCFNACSYSIGFFNTKPSTIYMFNKPCDLSRKKINELPGITILRTFKMAGWIGPSEMSNEEKKAHHDYTVSEGYLKFNCFKEAFKNFWQELDECDRQAIKDLPNFDPVIFKSITGIDISDS